MKTTFVLLYLFLFLSLPVLCQNGNLDSLLTVINTEKVINKKYYDALIKAGDLLTNLGKNDSAFLLYDRAQNLTGLKIDSAEIIEILIRKGICTDQKGGYEQSAELYFSALQIAERLNKEKLKVKALINLGILNFNLQKGETAVEYYKKALKISEQIRDTISIIRTLNNIGNASATLLLDYKSAEKYFLKTVELAEKINYFDAAKVGYNNLIMIYCHNNELGKAEKMSMKALRKSPTNPFAFYNAASVSHKKGDYPKAVSYYDSAWIFANNFPELKQVILKDKAEVLAAKKDFGNAFTTYKEYIVLKDSLHKTETDNHIKELDVKYQTANKGKEIIKLNSEKKLQRYLLYFLTIILVFGAITSFSAYRNIKNKKKITEQSVEIQKQKIRELEKDKQIVASHAVLEGEEKERSRLARDLHDGLGGLLSGVKLKLSGLKGNYVVTQESSEQFENAVNLLDNSIKELRRVAHNMMPEALIKFGIKDALQDFCDRISTNKGLKIKLNAFGENKRLEQMQEITVYRIGLELINNAIKHAKASEILVQLVLEETRIYLTIQDNGIGFDPDKINTLTSSGLKNIRARVESFNGRMDIDSKPGKGTEIGIEFDKL